MWPNQGAAANRRPAGQLDGSGNLFATVAADRAFPAAAVDELGRSVLQASSGVPTPNGSHCREQQEAGILADNATRRPPSLVCVLLL